MQEFKTTTMNPRGEKNLIERMRKKVSFLPCQGPSSMQRVGSWNEAKDCLVLVPLCRVPSPLVFALFPVRETTVLGVTEAAFTSWISFQPVSRGRMNVGPIEMKANIKMLAK